MSMPTKWVDWAGDLAVAPIISGIAPAVGDVMPEPMDRRWWPQRDSNPCFSLERDATPPVAARGYGSAAMGRCH